LAAPEKTPAGPSAAATAIAAALTWALPGLGHIYMGHRTRGIIFLVVIGVTFWGGVAIGGVKTTIQPQERQAWFAAQICTGSHALAAMAWSNRLPDTPSWEYSPYVAYYPADDISVVYTGVAGLLNVLVIFDILSRSERKGEPALAREAPPTRRSVP
jgi:TM2 domain-containing membrane protein YozV